MRISVVEQFFFFLRANQGQSCLCKLSAHIAYLRWPEIWWCVSLWSDRNSAYCNCIFAGCGEGLWYQWLGLTKWEPIWVDLTRMLTYKHFPFQGRSSIYSVRKIFKFSNIFQNILYLILPNILIPVIIMCEYSKKKKCVRFESVNIFLASSFDGQKTEDRIQSGPQNFLKKRIYCIYQYPILKQWILKSILTRFVLILTFFYLALMLLENIAYEILTYNSLLLKISNPTTAGHKTYM